MKRFILFFLIILPSCRLLAATNDNIDSLKQKLQITTNDSLKAYVYTEIAECYLKFDTIHSLRKKLTYQNEAINYTLLALHLFSRYNDTTGLRISYNNLATAYHAQKKYSQAKWFILQSNTISREKNDIRNIIASLIELAAIKTDIQDYKLATQDLNEALTLSASNHYPDQEAEVQKGYYFLYNRLNEYTKADEALKKHDYLIYCIRKDSEAKLMTKLNFSDSALNKKKVYSIGKKESRSNYLKRIASL